MADKNRDSLPYHGGNPADVRLNHWEYHDFIDHLLDDRMTAEGLMKLKRLHSSMAVNALAIPLVMFPFAWVANRWMTSMCAFSQVSLTEEWLHQDLTSWAWVSSILSSSTTASQDQCQESYILT